MRAPALLAGLCLVAACAAGRAQGKGDDPPFVLAYATDSRGNLDLFVATPGQAKRRRLDSRSRDELSPSWSADGRIAYRVNHPAWMPDGRLPFTRHGETGPIELWAMDADGRSARRLATSGEPVFVVAWTPF